MKTKTLKSPLILAVALALSPLAVQADDDRQEIEALTKQFGFITLEQAQETALKAKSGVVTDADLDDRDFGKGWDYEFEIVDVDGKEWDVLVDAKTGKVRDVSRDWF